MYFEKIVNVITGEESFREFTEAEIAQIEIAQKEAEKIQQEAEAKYQQKLALFEKLGITEEEAKLLLS
jgi:Asp-tRNA(Asn)/Glu-tRNA(Gln) amidotransferase B subunit